MVLLVTRDKTERANVATVILRYRLKPDADREAFEAWSRTIDQPAMRGLRRISRFDTYRVEGLYIGEDRPSCDYVEFFDIDDLAGFSREDLTSPLVQKIVADLMQFAEAPEFLLAAKV